MISLSSTVIHHLLICRRRERSKWERRAILLRSLLALILAVNCLVTFTTLKLLPNAETELAEILEVVVVSLSWILNFIYGNVTLKEGNVSHRGAKSVLFFYTICVIVDFVTARTDVFQDDPSQSAGNLTIFIGAIIELSSHVFYIATFLVPSSASEDYVAFEDEPASQARVHRRGALGIAKEFAPFLSKLFVYWVNPLIRKGRRGKIQNPDDVFGLPNELDTAMLSQEFQDTKATLPVNEQQQRVPLLKILYLRFKKPFLYAGFLKFVSDCAGFANPLLLNLIVSFMESKIQDLSWGCFYAFGLATSSFIVAICSTHFNLVMSELGLKVRASVISSVYDHTLAISNSEMSSFKVGEVINFMSTDTDRIVNFSPSIHAAWSLPFQFVVTLILLYN